MSRPTLRDLRDLPPTLKPERAFEIVGIGRTSGYRALRDGSLPCLTLGRKRLVPTLELLRLLGADGDFSNALARLENEGADLRDLETRRTGGPKDG